MKYKQKSKINIKIIQSVKDCNKGNTLKKENKLEYADNKHQAKLSFSYICKPFSALQKSGNP